MRNIIKENKIYTNHLQAEGNELNFILCRYLNDYTFEHIKLDFYNVIILLKGKIEIHNRNRKYKEVMPNQFYLVGKNAVLKGCVSKGSEILLIQFGHISHENIKIKLQNLRQQISLKTYAFRPLIANKQILLYIEQLKDLLHHKIKCPHYALGKVNELFHILEQYYTADDFITFCYPMITHSSSFKELILQNYLTTNSLKDLQECTGMSASTFNRKFKAEFNDSAYQWLLKQKAEQIKMRLMNESTTLSDIIREFGFHSHSHLQKYCKTHFNMNPSELKKRLRERSIS